MNKSDGDTDTLSQFDHKTSYRPENTTLKYYKYHNEDKALLNYLRGVKKLTNDNLDKHYDAFKNAQKAGVCKQAEDLTFTFGKYEGRCIAEILKSNSDKDMQYLKWMAFELSGNKRAESRFLERFFYYNGYPASNIVTSKTDDKDDRYNSQRRGYGKYKRRRGDRSRSPYNRSSKRDRSLSPFSRYRRS